MTDRSPDDELAAAIERHLAAWSEPDPDFTLTDVLVVTVRRGFDQRGEKSITSVLTPTDSSVPILLGMSRYAQLRFEKMINDSFDSERG